MKILFYNWVDYLDDEKRGGGVSVYQRNVIQTLRESADSDCWFLSSGISYDLLQVAPRWDRVRHGPSEDRRRRYEIVNSGVLSPAHHAFGDERQLDDPATTDTFMDFIRTNGPFDVVHFNNLEGLPASVLKLKEEWPETRVVFSLHNYYPVCPQVNLWHQERENCLDYDGGRKCETCLPHQHDPRIVRMANAVAYRLKRAGIRPGSRIFDRGFGPAFGIARRGVGFYNRKLRRRPAELPVPQTLPSGTRLLKQVEAPHIRFKRRREGMIELINTHCDSVLCVSDRVRQVAENFGISPKLLQTGYIGTRHAEKFDETAPRDAILKPDGTLTLGYLGYMRRDKGFFFLLDALEKLPAAQASRINVMIASKLLDQPTMDRITALSERFNAVLFADGYSHGELDELLEDVDLGVIPVLWEDNLPQVAIEMHARHIPLLTSDLGGAQELGRCEDLVFEAGSHDEFARCIKAILSDKVSMEQYWQTAMHPYSMQDHLAELQAVYDQPARAIALMPSAPPRPKAPRPKAKKPRAKSSKASTKVAAVKAEAVKS